MPVPVINLKQHAHAVINAICDALQRRVPTPEHEARFAIEGVRSAWMRSPDTLPSDPATAIRLIFDGLIHEIKSVRMFLGNTPAVDTFIIAVQAWVIRTRPHEAEIVVEVERSLQCAKAVVQ